jgi:rhodanese-related sulfurtransferase
VNNYSDFCGIKKQIKMDLQELINSDKVSIVDVRTPMEFTEGHVNGSINIPLNDLVERVEELRGMQPLVLCCASGGRSGQATDYLQVQGFEEVYNGGGWTNVNAQKL